MNRSTTSIATRVGSSLIPAFAVLLGSVMPVPAAFGQSADSIVVDLGECVNIASDEVRFACYERKVRESTASDTSAAVKIEPPAAALPQDQPSLEERRADRRAERERARAERESEANEQDAQGISALVAGLRETVPNSWLITLDNGEVWQQVDPKRFRLREGMQVTLSPTSFGPSYRLTASDLNGFIRVRRLR